MRALLVVLLVGLLLLVVWLVAETAEMSVEHDSVRVVAAWGREKPPYVIDEQMLTTTTTPRARTAPTKPGTEMRAASAAPTLPIEGTNWTDNKHAPPAGHWAGTVNGSPCGGPDIPSCRRIWIESKGLVTAYNPTGCGGRSCGGVAQFDPVTFIPGCTVAKWNNHQCGDYKGYQFAHLAPVDVQYDRIREVYAHGAGCAHWGSAECVGAR